jgi:hypothetical protein
MTYGTQIKIEIGAPLREGIYTVKIAWVKLVDATAEYADNRFFYKEELDKIDIKPDETGEELKQKCLTLYNEKNPEKKISVEDFTLKNPSFDFGQIIKSNDLMSDLNLYDDKEIFIHVNQPDHFLPYD